MAIKWDEYYEKLNFYMNRFGNSNLAETRELNHLSQRITSVKKQMETNLETSLRK